MTKKRQFTYKNVRTQIANILINYAHLIYTIHTQLAREYHQEYTMNYPLLVSYVHM